MTSRFFARATVITAVLSLALVGGVTTVAGQSADDLPGNETNTPEPVEGTVGPIDILDYQLQDGTMTIVVEARQPTAVAISDALAGLREGGVTSVPMKQETLRSGRQELTLAVSVVDGAGAVTISTPGDAVRIQTDAVGAGRPPVAFQQALLAVLVSGVGAGYYSYRRTRDEFESEDEPEVNRIA